MRHVILLDFGSTFTKLTVVDKTAGAVIHTDRTPSTVRTDARVCLDRCFDSARAVLGRGDFDRALKLSSSSAAGGLRMAVVGLSKTLSMAAARNAAFGAGAKIIGSFIGPLGDADIRELESLDVEIVLLTGGYENGSSEAVIHNADMVASSRLAAPVIYAGNSAVTRDVRHAFMTAGKQCYLVPNIIPRVGVLDTAPTEEIIRHVFMESIVNMKGLADVQAALDAPLVPTPAAVLSAGELLSLGTKNRDGFGPLLVVDVGGATTDIHSYVEQTPHEGARLMGTPEPYTRRTVEGDIGMRESSISLAEEIGWEAMAEKIGVDVGTLRDSVRLRIEKTNYVPDTEIQHKIDQEIAAEAVRLSARRHSGRIKYVHASNCSSVQYGKNVSAIRMVVGTGGPLVTSRHPRGILRQVCKHTAKDAEVLLPDTAEFYLDSRYVLYAAGILRRHDDDLAFDIMKKSLEKI